MQRLLWSDTRREGGDYPALFYLAALIGQDTIASITPEILALFQQ